MSRNLLYLNLLLRISQVVPWIIQKWRKLSFANTVSTVVLPWQRSVLQCTTIPCQRRFGPHPTALQSQAQMRFSPTPKFGPGPKCGWTLGPSQKGTHARVNIRFFPGGKCDSSPGPITILPWYQIKFRPKCIFDVVPKWYLVPDPNAIYSHTQLLFTYRPKFGPRAQMRLDTGPKPNWDSCPGPQATLPWAKMWFSFGPNWDIIRLNLRGCTK